MSRKDGWGRPDEGKIKRTVFFTADVWQFLETLEGWGEKSSFVNEAVREAIRLKKAT